jgi:hypothetical protein
MTIGITGESEIPSSSPVYRSVGMPSKDKLGFEPFIEKRMIIGMKTFFIILKGTCSTLWVIIRG